jgi:hypothetical protein
MKGKSVGEGRSKANTRGIFVSSLSQANAFQAECSLADRASGLPLADVRLIQKRESMRVVDEHIRNNEMHGKCKRSIEAIRRKRLRRNKKKKESLKFIKKQERKSGLELTRQLKSSKLNCTGRLMRESRAKSAMNNLTTGVINYTTKKRRKSQPYTGN